MDEDFFRVVQTISIFSTFVLGLVAAVKGLMEYSKSNRIREEELKWKKSLFARDLWNNHRTGKSGDCMRMLDWSGREYEISPGVFKQIWWPEMLTALRVRSDGKGTLEFDETEVFVRDCFDTLLQDYADFEALIENGLLDTSQIIRYCGYYIKKIVEHDNDHFALHGSRPIDDFMRVYGFENSIAFCENHSAWKKRKVI